MIKADTIKKELLRVETEKITGRVSYTHASDVLGEMRQIIDRAKVKNHE